MKLINYSQLSEEEKGFLENSLLTSIDLKNIEEVDLIKGIFSKLEPTYIIGLDMALDKKENEILNNNKKKELSEAIKGCTNGIVNSNTNVIDLTKGSTIDKAIKQLDEGSQLAVEMLGEYNKLSVDYKELTFDYKELSSQYNELVGMYKELGNRFLKENSEDDDYFEMFQILSHSIAYADLDKEAISQVQQDMEGWEEEGEFVEYAKKSYLKVIEEIREYSDMMNGVGEGVAEPIEEEPYVRFIKEATKTKKGREMLFDTIEKLANEKVETLINKLG